MHKINLNSKEIEWNYGRIYYADIMRLTGHKENSVVTVTVQYPEHMQMPAHSMTYNDDIVAADGIIINAVATNNA